MALLLLLPLLQLSIELAYRETRVKEKRIYQLTLLFAAYGKVVAAVVVAAAGLGRDSFGGSCLLAAEGGVGGGCRGGGGGLLLLLLLLLLWLLLLLLLLTPAGWAGPEGFDRLKKSR